MHILGQAGSSLDPMYSRLFAKAMGVFPVGSLVRLSDQTVGVVSCPGLDVLKPTVRVSYDAKGLDLEEPFELDLAEAGLDILEVISPDDLNVDVSERL
jgi:hypothetical protein